MSRLSVSLACHISAVVGILALAGCAGRDTAAPRCPSVEILKDAGRITVYRAGSGRDLSDITYEARLIGFDGDCTYTAANKEKRAQSKFTDVTLNLRPRIRVIPGPALPGSRVTLNYFVAMPEFYPNPEGRAEFTQTAEIPQNRTPLEFTDNDIQVRVPLGETRSGAAVTVYLGFVLTAEQLDHNRRRTGGRLEP